MNQLVIKKLVGADAGADVAPLILDEFANTASAGSIIAFHKHRDDLAAGDLGVICSIWRGLFHRQRGGSQALTHFLCRHGVAVAA
jgi:3-Oxoacyl-[acyl-carrier-protein (ACP)] synthase III C terminal.